MKTYFRILLLGFFLINVVYSAEAQTMRKRFTSDFHVGLNFAEMDIEGANMYKKPKLGMTLGINFNYKILHNIQLQSGFYVTKKGLKQHFETVEVSEVGTTYMEDIQYEVTGNYMQIPFCLGYEVYFSRTFAFNMNFGVYGAYGYKGNYTRKGFTTTIEPGQNPVITDLGEATGETYDYRLWRRWDYGAIGSVGFIFDIFMVNFNYEHGLYNISAVESNPALKNRNMTFSIGFRF